MLGCKYIYLTKETCVVVHVVFPFSPFTLQDILRLVLIDSFGQTFTIF